MEVIIMANAVRPLSALARYAVRRGGPGPVVRPASRGTVDELVMEALGRGPVASLQERLPLALATRCAPLADGPLHPCGSARVDEVQDRGQECAYSYCFKGLRLAEPAQSRAACAAHGRGCARVRRLARRRRFSGWQRLFAATCAGVGEQ
jgi:hypothetical protein